MTREEIGKMLENHEKYKKERIKALKLKKKLTIFEAAELSVLQGNGGSLRNDKSSWATPYNW
jgi:hypothetical protein